MTAWEDKCILARHPISSLIVFSMAAIILGLVLVFSVAGAILGIPLLILGTIAGVAASYKQRRAGGLPVDEIERDPGKATM